MNTVHKPVGFEDFLTNKYFQNFLRLRHFQFARDENDRLINISWKIIFLVLPVHFLFFSLNGFDVIRSLYLGVPSSQNLPVLTIATFFSVRGMMLFVKRTDIMHFLITLDEEFPKDLAAQRRFQVPQMLEKHLLRNKYANRMMSVGMCGFCLTPLVVYILTYEGNDAYITEDQQLLGGYMPFGIRQIHLAYPLVYFFDVFCSISGSSLYASVDTLYFAMQGQLIMHLEYLKRQICEIDMSDTMTDERELNAHLCQLIRRHQQLNYLFDKYNDIFKAMLMVTDFIAATTICFHLYLITETSDPFQIIKYALPSGILVLSCFETCLRGTHLADAVSRDLDDNSYYRANLLSIYFCRRIV